MQTLVVDGPSVSCLSSPSDPLAGLHNKIAIRLSNGAFRTAFILIRKMRYIQRNQLNLSAKIDQLAFYWRYLEVTVASYLLRLCIFAELELGMFQYWINLASIYGIDNLVSRKLYRAVKHFRTCLRFAGRERGVKHYGMTMLLDWLPLLVSAIAVVICC